MVISWRIFEDAVYRGPLSECDPLVSTVFNKHNKLTAVQAFWQLLSRYFWISLQNLTFVYVDFPWEIFTRFQNYYFWKLLKNGILSSQSTTLTSDLLHLPLEFRTVMDTVWQLNMNFSVNLKILTSVLVSDLIFSVLCSELNFLKIRASYCQMFISLCDLELKIKYVLKCL